MSSEASPDRDFKRGGILDLIERAGNKLPEPAILFAMLTILVMVLSQFAAWSGWEVQPKKLEKITEAVLDPATGLAQLDEEGKALRRDVLDDRGKPQTQLVEDGAPIRARGLFTADGLYYAISSLVDNFMKFPPLGVVLVGVLGIGVAERTGFIGAGLKAFMLAVPKSMLTPAMVFLGIMSSLGTDAGYIVLPPIAAALYKSVGRSPLAGIAAVFAGVAAGFNANLLVTSLDPLLAGFTTTGAKAIDPNYNVVPTCNWYFMIASTFIITLAGWAASTLFVEKRLSGRPMDEGGPDPSLIGKVVIDRMQPHEVRGLVWALGVMFAGVGLFLAFALIPGAPFDDNLGKMEAMKGLAREGDHFDRWVESIVPMLFFLFLVPGITYGVVVGNLRNSKDLARLMNETFAYMAPIIVLSFFAAQFIEYFKYSQLDRMLAYTGGELLARSGLGASPLILSFILIVMLFNIMIASMSAKYAVFAPIFVPMLMFVGISPELTQSAYRIGDSVTNVITPLNSYMVIILVVVQKHAPKAGMGTLISTMLPYTLVFAAVWAVMLLVWMYLGIPLGPGGPLTYPPQ
ncbi:MAG: AbgT family transporter [Phycisphaeraceae bacterium]|nr:AbgT family transporter [Phycisphaeraceae bacterium]MCW5753631.1 AbgT family transporter [Phycisphaeraceae bacterium]